MHSPEEFVCQCLEVARPQLDTRGHAEYTRLLGGHASADSLSWDGLRADLSPSSLETDHARLRALIDALRSWIHAATTHAPSSGRARRQGTVYTDVVRARESLARLEGFERLIDTVEGGPWSSPGTAASLRLARLHPALFWKQFWGWMGYAEQDDTVYQRETLDPDLEAFVARLGPGLSALLQESAEARRACRDALQAALSSGALPEADLATSYCSAALAVTGMTVYPSWDSLSEATQTSGMQHLPQPRRRRRRRDDADNDDDDDDNDGYS